MAIVNTSIAPLLKEGSNVTLTQDGQVITIATTGGGGTPAGSDTQIQFNDGGAFGGDAGLTYDKTNNIVDLESIDFATTPTAAAAVYRLNTDDSEGSLNLGLKGGNVNIALGAEVVIMSYNAEATTLNKGEVVYLYGAQGQRPSVKRASNTGDSTSATTFGMVAESIAAGAEGFVIQIGVIRNIDTNAYNEGDILWLGSTAGSVTTTKPYAPNHGVFVGVILKKNATSGRIFVKPQNGYEMDELHNVSAQSPSNNDILAYNTSTSLWEKKQLSAISGVTGTGTTNYLPKFTGASTIGDSQVRDNGTGVAIGGAPSAFKFDVTGLVNFTGTTASDGGQLGAELLSASGWTSTGWTGSFGAGWTHTVGNTTALTNTLAAVSANSYQIAYTITTRTAGTIAIAFGGQTLSNISATGTQYIRASSTATLSITPTTDFDGTLVISIKLLSAGSASVSLKSSSGTVTNEIRTSSSNTNLAIGVNAGSLNLGTNNIFIGLNAGRNNNSSGSNVFIGANSGQNNTAAINTFVGANSGSSNSTGQANSLIGSRSGFSITTGGFNTIIGADAGFSITTSTSNTAIGVSSAFANNTGGSWVAIGSDSATQYSGGTVSATSFSNSVYIGSATKVGAAGVNNELVIGYRAEGLGSNTTVIGNSSTTYGRWWGNLLVGTSTNSGYALDVSGTARIQNDLTISDTRNIILSTTTGTKIGTATTQKIGFFNATPVVQPGAVTTSQGIADALTSLGLLASSTVAGGESVGSKLYLFNSY